MSTDGRSDEWIPASSLCEPHGSLWSNSIPFLTWDYVMKRMLDDATLACFPKARKQFGLMGACLGKRLSWIELAGGLREDDLILHHVLWLISCVVSMSYFVMIWDMGTLHMWDTALLLCLYEGLESAYSVFYELSGAYARYFRVMRSC